MDLLKNFFKGDKAIWIIFLFLCLISVIEVFSASSSLSFKSGDHWAPITNHLTMLLVGACVVWIVHNIPCRWFKTFIVLLPISWILLVVVLIMGIAAGGAKRWIDLGFVQFQPSEVGKMATIITVAFILSKMYSEEGTDKRAFKFILGVTGATCLLIFSENLSTAVLLAVAVYLMMIIGRIPFKQMAKLTATGVVAVSLIVGAIWFIPANVWKEIKIKRAVTWKERIADFSNKEKVPAAQFDMENNAQVAHANIAIATSNVFGKGPGNSVQRDFLSLAFSDFIYAIIIEEMGLVGGAFVALLYILLLMRIGRIANKCDKPYYIFLIMGIGFLLVTQALFNMLVAVGIMPVTGQPLPLISKGGTSTLINCVYIGIILSVSRYVKEQEVLKAQEALAAQEESPGKTQEEAALPESPNAPDANAPAL